MGIQSGVPTAGWVELKVASTAVQSAAGMVGTREETTAAEALQAVV
jgi:hypothetical protein